VNTKRDRSPVSPHSAYRQGIPASVPNVDKNVYGALSIDVGDELPAMTESGNLVIYITDSCETLCVDCANANESDDKVSGISFAGELPLMDESCNNCGEDLDIRKLVATEQDADDEE